MLLRDSPYKGNATFDSVYNMAFNSLGKDLSGYRQDFLNLVINASSINKLFIYTALANVAQSLL